MTRIGSSDLGWSQGLTVSTTTDLDSIRDSARSIIAAKDAEIARLNREIDEAERLLDEGYQNQAEDEDYLKEEIARLEQELDHISLVSQTELQSIRDKHEREIEEVSSEHSREVSKLQKRVERASRNQAELQRAEEHARQLRGPSESNGSAEDSSIVAARARNEELQEEVRRLEGELRLIATEQQEQIAAQARAVERGVADSDVSGGRDQPKKEVRQAKAKLAKAKERNAQLDKKLTEVMAQNAQKQAEIATLKERAKGKPRPVLTDLTVVDAEIIRLADENEDLKVILQGLDKIAYDANR
jgi:chromosome segregation ATPase